jgi:hypothetical protein
VIFEIKPSGGGLYISSRLAGSSYEREVLLRSGTKYAVTGRREEKDGGKRITVISLTAT